MAPVCTDTQKPSSTNWREWRATVGEKWRDEWRDAYGYQAGLDAYNEQYIEQNTPAFDRAASRPQTAL